MAIRSKNIYKPRYNISLISKTDVWINKTSRLRGFFNIRGRKLHRRGVFKHLVLVLNDMKWTIARRFFQPHLKRKRRGVHRKYKVQFYTKQQIRAFYGIYKEETFRNMFKYFIGGAKKNRSLFFCSLESRLDVFLYRLRFLPTIYASRQFIRYCGLRVNNVKNYIPATRVNPGDIVEFRKRFWLTFYQTFLYRIYFRKYGLSLFKHRQFKKIRRRLWWINKNRLFYKRSLFFLARQKRLLWKFFQVVRNIRDFVMEFKKVLMSLKDELIHSTFNLNLILLPLVSHSVTSMLRKEVKKKLYLINWESFVLRKNILSREEVEMFNVQNFKIKFFMMQQFDSFILSTLDNFNLTWEGFRNKILLMLNSLKRRKSVLTHSKFRKFSTISKKWFFRFRRKRWLKSNTRIGLTVFRKKHIKQKKIYSLLANQIKIARNLRKIILFKSRIINTRVRAKFPLRLAKRYKKLIYSIRKLQKILIKKGPLFKKGKRKFFCLTLPVKRKRTLRAKNKIRLLSKTLYKSNGVLIRPNRDKWFKRYIFKKKGSVYKLWTTRMVRDVKTINVRTPSKLVKRVEKRGSVNRLFINPFGLRSTVFAIKSAIKKKGLNKATYKMLRTFSLFKFVNLLGCKNTNKLLHLKSKNKIGTLLKKRWYIWSRKQNLRKARKANKRSFFKARKANKGSFFKVYRRKVYSDNQSENIKSNVNSLESQNKSNNNLKFVPNKIIIKSKINWGMKKLNVSQLKSKELEFLNKRSRGDGLNIMFPSRKKNKLSKELLKLPIKNLQKNKKIKKEIKRSLISVKLSVAQKFLNHRVNRWKKWKTKKRFFLLKNYKNSKKKVFRLRWKWDRRTNKRFIRKKIRGFRRVHPIIKRRLRWKFVKLFKKLTKKMLKQKFENLTLIRKKFFSVIEKRKKKTPWKYSVLTFVSHTNLIFKAYRFLYFYLDLFFELESSFYDQILIFLNKIREVEILLVKEIYLKVYSFCFINKTDQAVRFKTYMNSTLALLSLYETVTV